MGMITISESVESAYFNIRSIGLIPLNPCFVSQLRTALCYSLLLCLYHDFTVSLSWVPEYNRLCAFIVFS